MRHEDVKTTSTRKLLPSGNVAGNNDNGIPVIPSIINSVPSASGIPNVVAAGGAVPDIVFGFNPENNESDGNVVSGYSEDSRTESEYSESEYSEAMTDMSREARNWDAELSSASIAVIQEFTRLKSGK